MLTRAGLSCLRSLCRQTPRLRTNPLLRVTFRSFGQKNSSSDPQNTEIPTEIKIENEEPKQNVMEEEPVINKATMTHHNFQAETKKLLQIVAKSLYTDKDVFIRELLSNCSDAIEKQRFMTLTGKSNSIDPLQINVITNEAKHQIIFQDTGIGMSKQELIENLGTIASSGSKKFLEKIKDESGGSKGLEENIIGQFGVGFYSTFIVGDTIEVFSKKEGESKAHVWISDGSGTFDVFEADNFHLTRGTRIIIHLKPDYVHYSRADEIKKVIDKYSNFISHPIFLNQDRINIVSALWSRDRREVQENEYLSFYEFLSKSKTPYKYKTHLSLEVPLSIKALLYVPSQNAEMFGFSQGEIDLALYSRRVLIKNHCKELLPNYLRFVKGVVDCEDLPLNISRENYQDSALIAKLRNILTKRILKLLEEESKKSPEDYNKWHKDFHMYIKEGIHVDKDNAEMLLSLSRFDSTFKDQISLDDYLTKLKPHQKNIYYFLANSREAARHSPYMEPFLKNEIPVLFISINVEEMLFRQMENYKKFHFVNIESAEAEIPKELLKEEILVTNKAQLPSDDVASFCLWVKNELQPIVSTVNVSKRLTDSPALIIASASSGMRQMMAFLDQSQMAEMNKNLTFEINPTHSIITKLNQLRKDNPKAARFNLRQLLDSCLLSSGIGFDVKSFIKRVNEYIESNLETNLGQKSVGLDDGAGKSEDEEKHGETITEQSEQLKDSDFQSLSEALKKATGKKKSKETDAKSTFSFDDKKKE